MSVQSLKKKLLRARVLYVLGLLSPIIAIASITIHVCEVFDKSNALIAMLLCYIFGVFGIYSTCFFTSSGTREDPSLRTQLKNDISNLKLAIPKEIDRLPKTW